MRISSQMVSNTVMSNLSAVLDRMYVLQTEGSSQKRINQSSDDPLGTAKALSIQSSIASVTQYASNVTRGQGELSYVDSTLNSVTQSLVNAKQYALTGANATTDAASRANLATQVQQVIDSIVSQMNGSYQNRYVFGGNQTQTAPISATTSGTASYQYNGDDGVAKVQVSDTSDVAVSTTAAKLLNFGGATDASKPDTLSVLVSLKNDLTSGDTAKMQTDIANIDSATQSIIAQRASMGTNSALLSLYSTRLASTKTTLTTQLSGVEDADITEVVTQLQSEQNVYQSALLVAARMSQQNLGDYLK
jgi:flagellar hook-associated protein 3 FlgL